MLASLCDVCMMYLHILQNTCLGSQVEQLLRSAAERSCLLGKKVSQLPLFAVF